MDASTALRDAVVKILQEAHADLVEYGSAHEQEHPGGKLGRCSLGYNLNQFAVAWAAEHFVGAALSCKPRGMLLNKLEVIPSDTSVRLTLWLWEPEVALEFTTTPSTDKSEALGVRIRAIFTEQHGDLVEYGKQNEEKAKALLAVPQALTTVGRFALTYDLDDWPLETAAHHFVEGTLRRKPKGILLSLFECTPVRGKNQVAVTAWVWEPQVLVPL